MAKPIHDGNAVKSLRRQMMILRKTQNSYLQLFSITYRKELVIWNKIGGLTVKKNIYKMQFSTK